MSFFVLTFSLAGLVGVLVAAASMAVVPQDKKEADQEEHGCGAAEAGGYGAGARGNGGLLRGRRG